MGTPSLRPYRHPDGPRNQYRRGTVLRVEQLEDRAVPTVFTVTNLLDDGSTGTLRWAVGKANAAAGADTVAFAAGLTGTVTLTQGQLALTDTTGPTTVAGPGADKLAVSGQRNSNLFVVRPGATVTFNGLTIRDGFYGVFIDRGRVTVSQSSLVNCLYAVFANRSTATVSESTVAGNTTGVTVFDGGTVTVSRCTLTGNATGVFANRSTATVSQSTIAGTGTSTGVYAFAGGTVTVSRCTLTGNATGVDAFGGSATVSESTVAGNTTGVTVFDGGTVTVSRCTLTGNATGVDAFGGSATVSQSTIAGTGTSTGVYAFAGGTVTVSQSTVVNCLYAVFANRSTATFNQSTVAGNTYGAFVFDGGTVSGTNTLVVGNGTDLSGGSFSKADGNLVGLNGYQLSQIVRVDAAGKPLLADNGGPTQTVALAPGSPAFNAGLNANAVDPNGVPLATDQRGAGFVRVVGGTVDVGAFEVQAPRVQAFRVLYGNGRSYDLLGLPAGRVAVPWAITGIQVVFTDAVTGTAGSLGGFGVGGFTGSGTNTLTWTFTTPISIANVTAVLQATGADAVRSGWGLPLDGTGGGAGGSPYTRRVAVLAGDFDGDGVVTLTDMVQVRNLIGNVANPFADVNGDGVVDINDVNYVRGRIGTRLPP